MVMQVSCQFCRHSCGPAWSWRFAPGDGSLGHCQLAVHDGRQALGAVPASGALHEALTVSISSDDSALRLDMIGDMAVCA
jgi:hypothetical protein